jgi:hypothetical protein
MTEIVLMSDPKIAAVHVQECGERLVDLRRDGHLLVDERKWQDSAGAFAYLREGVLDRLLKAQAQLPQTLLATVFAVADCDATADNHQPRLQGHSEEPEPRRHAILAARCRARGAGRGP